ncbi:MAG: D-alanyl-D-alanine carboxypeptidase [Firmicutes bacterium]|jgi:D-alanyl-D-alanine carboxypeptidase (penicillin-binding protein 5/6)|nr:D-alanyl-D-alanine carboxypeptidase [Bacillota bacterium]
MWHKNRMRTKAALVAAAVVLWCALGAYAASPLPELDIEAEAAILVDAATGQVLYEKNADLQLPPASMAKIMTMLLVMEEVEAGRIKLTDEVRVSARAARIGGSQVYLREGEVFTVEELMKAVTIHSANDASVALAEHVAGVVEAFVDLMNRRARELGMNDTYYDNPDGLPSEPGRPPTLTTARDLTIVSRELLKYPEILEWATIRMIEFRANPKTNLYNTNKLIGRYAGLDGLKTGHTDEAGWCLTATAKRGDTRLISVVMRTNSEEERQAQTVRLLDYGFRYFEPVILAEQGEDVATLKVANGWPGALPVQAKETFRPLVPRGRAGEIELKPDFDGVRAPLSAGQKVGAIVAMLDGEELARMDVVVSQDVKQANFLIRFFRWIARGVRSLFRR